MYYAYAIAMCALEESTKRISLASAVTMARSAIEAEFNGTMYIKEVCPETKGFNGHYAKATPLNMTEAEYLAYQKKDTK